MDIEGKDLVAMVAIIVCGVNVYFGHDGLIISLLATIIGWYFGSKNKTKTEATEK